MPNKECTSEKADKVINGLEQMHPEAMCALDHVNSYELLVAVVLSAQTTDVSVNKVTPELFKRYPAPSDLAAADPADVQELIRTIGLYKNKSKNIISLARMITDEFGGEVPDSFDQLIRLPGVGRKTANVVLAEAFGVPRIAVDTHVFRVSNRIGLSDAENVDDTEKQLMKNIPEDKWIRAHHLLIFHGRKVCHSRKPDCRSCLIRDLCMSYISD